MANIFGLLGKLWSILDEENQQILRLPKEEIEESKDDVEQM